jgi:pimeloyl-ACP methyl ester carboxylesterase
VIKSVLTWAAVAVIGLGVLGAALYVRPDLSWERLYAQYANEESETLALADGAQVHLRDEGPRNAPVVVLLHGYASSLQTWDAWAAALSTQYRVIRFDFPGHGLTRASPQADVSVPGLIDFTDRVLAARGIERFSLAGNSMGGHVAWRYALAHPEKVRALILVDAVGVPEAPAQMARLASTRAMFATPALRGALRYVENRGLMERAFKAMVGNDALVSKAFLDRHLQLARGPGNRALQLRIPAVQFYDAAEAQKLGEILRPTLILQGEIDPLAPLAVARAFDRLIPSSELIVYKNVGHIPQEEIPQQSARDAAAFLDYALAAPSAVIERELPPLPVQPPR